MIEAKCHSDDFQVEVKFNAINWFKQAVTDELVALARCDFGGDKAADQVALFRPPRTMNRVFTYCRITGVGFECHVDADQAMAWIREHRPDVAAEIEE